MTIRPARIYKQRDHDERAFQIISGYSLAHSWAISLPIPIENIIEEYFELHIVYLPIEEPKNAGEIVLGLLRPDPRQIVLNETHLALFDSVIGPREFTLAHELGHWIYDVSPSGQDSLFSKESELVLCRKQVNDRKPIHNGLRETNANKFAASILLPKELMERSVMGMLVESSSYTKVARALGVSKTTLNIRMRELNLRLPIN